MGCSASEQRLPYVKQMTHLPRQADVTTYVEYLRTAIANNDDISIIKCLQECQRSSRSEVKDKYQEVTGTPLLRDCKNRLSVTSSFTAELLLLPRPDVTSYLLHRYLSEGVEVTQRSGEESVDTQRLVVEMVCLCPETCLSEVSTIYKRHHGEDLVKVIQRSEVISTEVKLVLAALLQSDRITDLTSNEDSARYLVEGATQPDFFSPEGPFMVTIATKSFKDLQEIFETYLQTCQRSLTAELEKTFPPGPTRDGLSLIVETLRTPWLWLSGTLHHMLSSTNILHQMTLLYYILTLTQEEVTQLNKTYKTTFFETLTMDVKAEVQDETIQRTLIAALR